MKRLATKSDLAQIITSGGGTFSSSSNEVLVSSYALGLNQDTIGGTVVLDYTIPNTGRSSYLSNECVQYEDISFVKKVNPSTGTFEFTLCSGKSDPYLGTSSGRFGTELGSIVQLYVNNVKSDDVNYLHIKSTRVNEGVTSYPEYTISSIMPSWLLVTFTNDSSLPYKENLAYKVLEDNPNNTQRSFTLTLTQSGSNKTISITFVLLPKQSIFLPNFTDIILNYKWTEQDGTDLDTSSKIGYIDNEDNEVWLDPVGFKQSGNNNDSVKPYIIYGGDNIESGDEGAAIRFSKYMDSLPKGSYKKIIVEARANWFESKGEGNIEMSYVTYNGGDISQNGFKFSSTGEKITEGVKNLKVYSFGKWNYEDAGKWYTKTLRIEYDPKFSSAAASITFDIDKSTVGYCTRPNLRAIKNITTNYTGYIIWDSYLRYDDRSSYNYMNCYVVQYSDNQNQFERGNTIEYEIENYCEIEGVKIVYNDFIQPGCTKTEYGYKRQYTITDEDSSYIELELITGCAPRAILYHMYIKDYREEEGDKDLSHFYLGGISTDENPSTFEGSSSLIFDGPYTVSNINPKLVTIDIDSLDKDGNYSNVTCTDNGGTTVNVNNTTKQLTVLCPNNTNDSWKYYTIHLKNDYDRTRTFNIYQRGYNLINVAASPIEYYFYDITTGRYGSVITLDHAAQDATFYIKVLENDIATLLNTTITCDDSAVSNIQLDKSTGKVTFHVSQNDTISSRNFDFHIQTATSYETVGITQNEKR